MSQENVELARRAYELFNARDWEAFVALMHDDVKVESRLIAIEGGYRGHEGTRRWWDAFLGAFPDYTLEMVELRDLGDVTLAHYIARGHGATSGTPLVDPLWQPIRWQDGKAVWWRVCATEEEALEAAGLEGEAGIADVEVVRRALDATGRGDWAAFEGLVDPEIEWTPVPSDPTYQVYRGLDEVRRWGESWLEAFPEMRWECEELFDVGGGVVLAYVRLSGRGGSSGLDTQFSYATVFTVRDGRIERVHEFPSRRQAHMAVGLPEPR
jgi:ketosteroid isomerase-like protein